MLALLADRVGGIDVAEDCLQDAYARATVVWSRDGLPDAPAAWIYTVARNAGIDRLRRAAVASRRLSGEARVLEVGVADRDPAREADGEGSRGVAEYAAVGDETLRLMLLCCHPALAREAQVALTLRLVGGLTIEEIAAAYLVPEATIAQRTSSPDDSPSPSESAAWRSSVRAARPYASSPFATAAWPSTSFSPSSAACAVPCAVL